MQYNLLKKWGDYLVTNALIPAQEYFWFDFLLCRNSSRSRISADSLDSSLGQIQGNLTNLAVKGIIAIRAMGEISEILGEAEDAQYYNTTATSLAESWVNLASSSTIFAGIWPDSVGLMYNLFADRLLQLNVVAPAVSPIRRSGTSSNIHVQIYAAESSTIANSTLQGSIHPTSATRTSLIFH
ncbi:hypothetical protein B0H13DRAFT_1646359 [Mycena leptocephala]|nr:hypothetical protein B0H13DRAFT_1646359 [Mycena leptocephala]